MTMSAVIILAGALLVEGAACIALVAWLLHRQDQRERDLLNRLMSRDLREYQQTTVPAPAAEPTRHNFIHAYRQRQRQTDPESHAGGFRPPDGPNPLSGP